MRILVISTTLLVSFVIAGCADSEPEGPVTSQPKAKGNTDGLVNRKGGESSTARVNDAKILLNDAQVTEEEFFKYLTTLDHKLHITCDVYDQVSDQYIHNSFLPKIKSKMTGNEILTSLIHIEVVEE